MSTLSLSPFNKFNEAVSYMKIDYKFTLNRHQLGTQLSIQLYKIHFSEQVGEQVTEHVAPTDHRGHGNFTAEVESTAIQGGVE